MSIKSFKAKTPSLRGTMLLVNKDLAKGSGPRKLSIPKKMNSGRNNRGVITVRHRGGGVKRRIRIIDFKREKFDVPAKVVDLYYDPNRSANIALLQYLDGEKRYIIAPSGLKKDAKIVSGEQTDVITGNSMRIKNIPSGTLVNCVEIIPGKGAKIARSAGNSVLVQGKDSTGKYVQVKMPSGEIRLINADCMATIGNVGNEERVNVKIGKAGRKRLMGWRPVVRGMAMHAVGHPHGGGEGKGVIGRAKDIWGHRLGTKTRKNRRTNRFIINRRKVKTRPNG